MPTEQIEFRHATPARFWADEDLNVAFPCDRMAELESGDTIGSLAPDAATILGSITEWDQLVTETAPRIHHEFACQHVDLVVVLVPFCPQYHQATAVLALALEARGAPTLILSTLRAVSEAYLPRTALLDYPIGSPSGRR